MKILYIHQYFKTPEEGGAIRSFYLAKGLVDNGYQVDLITSHNEKNYLKKNIEGIQIHYLPVFYKNQLGFGSRIFSFLKFAFLALKKARSIKKSDLCYVTSTPLTVGLIALALKYLNNTPYIFEVRDLWPEAPVQMGVIKNKILITLLKRLEKVIYKESKEIVALSPAMKDHILKIIPTQAITVIPNMADLHFFETIRNPSKQLEINKKFIITYFGAIGKVNHLQNLLEIAEASLENENIEFLIIGEGAELKNLISLSRDKKLTNIQFLPHQSKFQLKEQLQKSDAVFISFKNVPILQSSSPNKFFDGLAAGKLIILNFKGWLKDLVELHQCGIFVDPLHPHKFLESIEPFITDKNHLLQYQKNSVKLAAKYFSKELQIKKLISIIEEKKDSSIIDSSAYILSS